MNEFVKRFVKKELFSLYFKIISINPDTYKQEPVKKTLQKTLYWYPITL